MIYKTLETPFADIQSKIIPTFDKLDSLLYNIREISKEGIYPLQKLLLFGESDSHPFCPIGFIGYDFQKGIMEIKIMQIDKRKQRMGFGTMAVSHLFDNENPREIVLEADERTHQFWYEQGFKPVRNREDNGYIRVKLVRV